MPADSLMRRIALAIAGGGLTPATLETIAGEMREAARDRSFWLDRYPAAGENEELVYAIAVEPNSGAALYLVSDAPGTASPPHTHLTWAVIAGISGDELNRLYALESPGARLVRETKKISVAEGGTLILPGDAIHATEVVGPLPTFHLHLYGTALDRLPPFSRRTYSIAAPGLSDRPGGNGRFPGARA